ncbi:MAG: hypothetical protein QN120_05130 [Armatimonadota bacterium]|nr:hypothetical protein [Armatimonadota bacterium]
MLKKRVRLVCRTCRLDARAASLAVGLKLLENHRGHRAAVVLYSPKRAEVS